MRISLYSRSGVHLLAGSTVIFPKGNPLLSYLDVHAVELGLVMAGQNKEGLPCGCKPESKQPLLLSGNISKQKVGGHGHGIRGA